MSMSSSLFFFIDALINRIIGFYNKMPLNLVLVCHGLYIILVKNSSTASVMFIPLYSLLKIDLNFKWIVYIGFRSDYYCSSFLYIFYYLKIYANLVVFIITKLIVIHLFLFFISGMFYKNLKNHLYGVVRNK